MFEDIDKDVSRIKELLAFLTEKHGFSAPTMREEWYGSFLYYYKNNIGICAEYDFRDKFFGLNVAQIKSVGRWPEFHAVDTEGNIVAGYPTTIITKGLNLRDLGISHATGKDEIEKQINRDVYLIEKYMPSVFDGSDEVFRKIKTK
jgi:hypothetical protein